MNDELIAHFDNPPVVEVIAGVSFEGLGADAGPMLAAFWKERLRSEFPNVSAQPPYHPSPEQFPAAVMPTDIQFDVSPAPLFTRLWLTRADGSELIQVQPGWFACNWRKVKKDDEYDHWQSRRNAFVRWHSELADYVRSEHAGVLKMTQAEVTYVNHIEPNGVWQHHSDFERIFTASLTSGWSGVGKLEQIAANATFRLEDDHGTYGRMYVKLQPAFSMDDRPLYVLELTARGPVGGEDVSVVETFFNKVRSAIVRTFLDLTTREIQTEWGVKNVDS